MVLANFNSNYTFVGHLWWGVFVSRNKKNWVSAGRESSQFLVWLFLLLHSWHTCIEDTTWECLFKLTPSGIEAVFSWWVYSPCNFGWMLSVGTIHLEYRVCASKKGRIREVGGCHPPSDSTWQLSALAGPFLFFLANGLRNCYSAFVGAPFLAL